MISDDDYFRASHTVVPEPPKPIIDGQRLKIQLWVTLFGGSGCTASTRNRLGIDGCVSLHENGRQTRAVGVYTDEGILGRIKVIHKHIFVKSLL